jgi:hypothetical protein
MTPVWLGQARARWGRGAGIALVLTLGIAGAGWGLVGSGRRVSERLLNEAAEQGWLLEAGSRDLGLLSSSIRNARFSWRNASGVAADIERIDIRHWPWRPPRVTAFNLHARLRGELVPVLRSLSAAARWKDAPVVVGPVEVTYDHRVLGTVELAGVTLGPAGESTVLQAERVRVGQQDWPAVTLAFEPHKEMFVIAAGDSVAKARVQLSCFPSSEGKARWLLDVLHQPARPLASRVGWELGSDFEAARVAGSVSLDIPDNAAERVQGRMQLVVDGWPTLAPASATPWLGNT